MKVVKGRKVGTTPYLAGERVDSKGRDPRQLDPSAKTSIAGNPESSYAIIVGGKDTWPDFCLQKLDPEAAPDYLHEEKMDCSFRGYKGPWKRNKPLVEVWIGDTIVLAVVNSGCTQTTVCAASDGHCRKCSEHCLHSWGFRCIRAEEVQADCNGMNWEASSRLSGDPALLDAPQHRLAPSIGCGYLSNEGPWGGGTITLNR